MGIPPIRVYGAQEREFSSNGFCCLMPKSAEATLKENEAHSVQLEHPVDDFGIWKYLQMSNILYVPIKYRIEVKFQPMRIYEIQKKRSSGSASIVVKARHVFYDLNYMLLRDVRPTLLNGQAALNWMFNNVYRPTANSQASDYFTYSSDIQTTGTAYFENKTLTAALISEKNCVLNTWNGELFVDGFRFSINSRMEGAQDNAFSLRYGLNLTGITATYSTEKTFSAFVGVSSTKEVRQNNVNPQTAQLPYDKTQYAQFSYGSGADSSQFGADFTKYVEDNSKVSAAYSVTFDELGDTEEYKDFKNLASCEVGDIGTVYDPELDINVQQKIIEKKIDILTQKTKSVNLGNAVASITDTRLQTTNVIVSSSPEQIAQAYTDEQIRDLQQPKKTAQGAAPLTVYAYTALPSEAYLIRGNVGGVGEDYGGAVRITIISNGSVSTVGDIPRKLEADDYLQRFEGGRGVVHYSNGEEFPVDIGYINLRRGANEITVGGSVLPAEMEVIYR